MSLLDKLGAVLKDKPKSASDTVHKLVAAFNILEVGEREKIVEKSLESISKYLQWYKAYLFGSEEHEVTKDSVLQLAEEACQTDLLYLMVKHLALLDFESRKDAAQVFGATVRLKDADEKSPGAQYVLTHTYIVEKLFSGYVLQDYVGESQVLFLCSLL